MKVAAAQIESKLGDTSGNLKKHLALIKTAAQNQVDLIVFPEMSLTAYCREEGKALALKESGEEMISLKKWAVEYNLIIVVGGPVEIKGDLYIASFILKPQGEIEIYTKQYLHSGEEIYYSSSFDYNPVIRMEEEVVALAICADIDHPQHPKAAKDNDCTLYLPSIFFSEAGIDNGHELLSKYAKENSFAVLMSNYSGEVWNLEAGGKSSFWNKNGEKMTELSAGKEGLLIVEKERGGWTVKTLG